MGACWNLKHFIFKFLILKGQGSIFSAKLKIWIQKKLHSENRHTNWTLKNQNMEV